ncbi:cupin domain-containing protein [Tateyamaria omphalii]|uniref:cupin domain-containing protein n=1 Tax=Tateyamaria omphalii TaxID=299262 RepID=UPI001671A7EB|nr:cupin domain-containing protein [Tateyamaria omphalii]
MKPLAALLLATTPALADPAIILTPSDTLEWDTTPEGVAFAPLSGDRMAEPYFAMVRLPAGTVSPPHTKSATMFGVMLEGQMTHAAPDAQNPAIIGPGGYYEIPANMAHVSACISDSPCVTMLYQDGAFDFLPVTP